MTVSDAFIEESGRIWDEMEEQAEARAIRICEWAKSAYNDFDEVKDVFVDSYYHLYKTDSRRLNKYAVRVLPNFEFFFEEPAETGEHYALDIAELFFQDRHKPENKELKAYILNQLEEYADVFVE